MMRFGYAGVVSGLLLTALVMQPVRAQHAPATIEPDRSRISQLGRDLVIWDARGARLKTVDEQTKLLEPVFATLKDSEEKIAFLRLGSPSLYVDLVQPLAFDPYVAKLLDDADPKVQAAAIVDLDLSSTSDQADDCAPKVLALSKSSDTQLAATALRALGSTGRVAYIDTLTAALKDPRSEVIDAATTGLGALAAGEIPLADRNAIISTLRRSFDEKSPRLLRIACLKGLAIVAVRPGLDFDTKQAITGFLVDAVKDGQPDREIRLAGIDGLSKIAHVASDGSECEQMAMAAMLDAAEHSTDTSTRTSAIRAMDPSWAGPQDINAKKSVAVLMARLVNDREMSVRLAAMDMISKLHDLPEAAAVLPELRVLATTRPAADDTSDVVRISAVRALGGFHDHDSVAVFVQLLNDPNRDVRIAALIGISDVGLADQVDAVAAHLSATEPSERLAAMGALNQMRAAHLKELIAGLADDPDATVKGTARTILERR